jgi:hypothetical protein
MNQVQPSAPSTPTLPKMYGPRSFNLRGGPILAAAAILLLVFGCQAGGVLIWLGIAGIMVLPFGIFITAFGLLNRNKRAVVTDDTFSYVDGAIQVSWPWEAIESVTFAPVPTRILGISTGTTYRYILQHENGQQISLDNRLHKYTELGALVQAYVAHYRTPSIITRFHNAQVISFGDYAVDREALWHNDQRLPWSEVDHIDLKQSRLYVYQRGQTAPWEIIPVFRLPNMRILLGIVQGVIGIQQQTSSRPASD